MSQYRTAAEVRLQDPATKSLQKSITKNTSLTALLSDSGRESKSLECITRNTHPLILGSTLIWGTFSQLVTLAVFPPLSRLMAGDNCLISFRFQVDLECEATTKNEMNASYRRSRHSAPLKVNLLK